ncbi:putative porin [Paraburkholderia sacchari]|uniref:porin n=1 Tax=Paraburkholderia sacchari TaxID=159450 RepID=UPI0039A71123
MQRKLALLAATVGLTASTCGFAQGSVTLYGIVDGALLYTSKTYNAATGGSSGRQFAMVDSGTSPSQFGMSGTEDLGDGWRASFRIESGFSVANGSFSNSNGNAFGRQAWLAMNGKLGEFKVGLQFSPFFVTLYETDPRGMSMFGSGLLVYADHLLATGIFNSNAVSYTSPDIAGLSGSAMFAFGGSAGNFQAGRQYSVSLKYQIADLMVNAAIYNGNDGSNLSAPVGSTVAFDGRTLGATYKFGTLTAKASFTNYKVAQSFNSDVYGGGLDYMVLPQLDINGGIWFTSDRNDTKNHSFLAAVGANYLTSKATTLYAQVGVVNNHGAMNTGMFVNGALYGATGTTIGAVTGIRTQF